jgi:membrane protein implicated in regulation of membrane protease activity
VSESVGRTLVPPRPNLGPEPWTTSPPLNPNWLLLAIPTAVVFVWAFWKFLRRSLAGPRQDRAAPDEPDVTPRGRLVALSMSTKNALAARFGATWRAKTTEELATEPTLAEVLGPEPLRELIEFLDRIDRLKFAVERPNQVRQPLENELADWGPRIAGVIARIEARTNGRQNKNEPGSTSATAKPAGREFLIAAPRLTAGRVDLPPPLVPQRRRPRT